MPTDDMGSDAKGRPLDGRLIADKVTQLIKEMECRQCLVRTATCQQLRNIWC
jgi:hypothetical protein